MELYAFVGEDESSGVVGLKQAATPAGMIPLASSTLEQLDRETIKGRLRRQADIHGKPIRLVRFVEVDTVLTIHPEPNGDDGDDD